MIQDYAASFNEAAVSFYLIQTVLSITCSQKVSRIIQLRIVLPAARNSHGNFFTILAFVGEVRLNLSHRELMTDELIKIHFIFLKNSLEALTNSNTPVTQVVL
jgi:hypothetical protein